MPQSDFSDFSLITPDREILLQTARQAIAARLRQCEPVYPPPTPAILRRCGAFVTLHKVSDEGTTLRGCIGYIGDSYQLVEAVKRAAAQSAFHDARFPPLELSELSSVRIEISVLSPFRRIRHIEEVRPGIDGLYIRRNFRSGLLLPQVATEYGWNREMLLEHTCMKAGLPPTAYQDPTAEIEAFTAIVFAETENTNDTAEGAD